MSTHAATVPARTHAGTIRQAMDAGDVRHASEATAALFDTASPEDAVNQFTEASRGYPAVVLGWVLFPAILPHLRKSDELFRRMTALAGQDTLPEPFHLVLLDALKEGASARSDRETYWAALRTLATSPSQTLRVRARAARSLGQDCGEATARVLRSLIDSENPALVDAAAFAVRSRSVWKKGSSDELAHRLAEYAEANAGHAKRSSAVLRALADIGTASCRSTLHKLAGLRASDEEQARLIAVAGHALDDATLADMVHRASEPGNPESVSSLQGLFATNPGRLRALAESGRHDAYLRAATLVAASGGHPSLDMLETVCASKDPAIAALTRRLVELAPSDSLPESLRRQRSEVRVGQRSISVDQFFMETQSAAAKQPSAASYEVAPARAISRALPDPHEPPEEPPVTQPPTETWPRPAAGALSSGLHLGCGVYCTLGWSNIPGLENHWHTGLFAGFEPDSGLSVTMRGVQMAKEGSPDSTTGYLQSFSVSYPVPAKASLSNQLYLLRASLLGTIGGSEQYQGSHTVPGLSMAQRAAIANTARALAYQDIEYALWHQIDAICPASWTGEISQIAALRCDGVVEYCYEKNNVRVCGGVDPSLWNITGPGAAPLDNHSHWHYGAYDPGEVCPRIQAGPTEGHGSDSTFADIPASTPQVLEFAVMSASADANPAPKVPSIWFRPVAEHDLVYLRITVSKQGDTNYYFVKTEDVPNHPQGIAAGFRLYQLAANTPRRFAWWRGQTVGGPNFSGQNGLYNFRIVAVDQCGSVSAEVSILVTLTW